MPVVDLSVDRNLLCSNFDGYKLSFDAVPVIRQSLQRDPLKLEPHANQYSLLHTELFAKHNLLFSDPWARHNGYYFNTLHQLVLCSYDEQRGQPREQRVVYDMMRHDHGDGYAHNVGDYNYTLRFISEKYCVICDGMLTYTLVDTGDRGRAANVWQLITRTPINDNSCQDQRGFVLYDARLDIVQERKEISLVAGHVRRRVAATERETDVHIMHIICARWSLEAGASAEPTSWKYEVCQRLETKGSIYYCAFEPRAQSVVICSNGELQTEAQAAAQRTAERERELETTARAQLHNGNEQQAYTWTQTDEDLTLRFQLPNNTVTRNDIRISATEKQLQVECQSQLLLDETLYGQLDSELTNWTLEDDELQLNLSKVQAEQWPRLLAEPQGDEPLEQEQLPIPNLEDPIEECDFPLGSSSEDIKMIRFHLPTSMITHTIFLGSTPPLFGSTLRAGYPAAFATRLGVDGVVWLQQFQPTRPDEWSVRHEGTLHAFGYVQASKTQRKYVDCCPDLEYAVICESYRHVFIYKPRNDSAGGLRNRNGPQVVIGKQHLITLDDDVGEILGMVTAPNVIIILTEHAIFYLQV